MASTIMLMDQAQARHRPLLAANVLGLFNLGFWVAFGRLEHMVSTITTARTEVLLVAPLLLAAPLVFGLLRVLARHGLEPSVAIKFGVGFVLLALSCFFLALGVEWAFVEGAVGLWSAIACTSMLALAALSLAPASLAAARGRGAGDHKGVWLGAWLLCVLGGRALGTWTSPSPSMLTLDQLFTSCLSIGLSAVITGVALAMLWRPLSVPPPYAHSKKSPLLGGHSYPRKQKNQPIEGAKRPTGRASGRAWHSAKSAVGV